MELLDMNPNLVTLYKCPFPKKRIGRLVDGGYVIADIPGIKYDALIAGGVCDDVSFEEDFIRYQSSDSFLVYAYDGTVGDLPQNCHFKNQFRFTQKNIGGVNSDSCTNLHSVLDDYAHSADPKLFVKMDIEGGEVPWIKSLDPIHMNAIAQFVMEFHRPFGQEEIEMFKKINQTHIMVHLHPNNACGDCVHQGVFMPNVFECTYLHKRFFNGEAELNMDYIPNDAVDSRNIPWNAEIYMSHPPFVHFERFIRKL
jgi:hypothetical protein